MSRISLVLVGILLLWAKALSAQPVIDLSTVDTQQAIGLQLSYLRDTTHQLTLDEVSSSLASEAFVPSSRLVPNFGLSDVTYWLRLRIKNSSPETEQWFFEVAYPLLDSITLFQPDPSGGWHITVGGERVGVRKQPVLHKHFLFPLAATDTATHTYYLRIRTEGSARLPVYLRPATSLYGEISTEEAIFGIFYGAMIAMILYNLFLFFALREQSYLFYCAFILLNTCVQATFNGHIQLADIAVEYANLWLLISMCGAAFFGILFTAVFLQTKQNLPFLHRLLVGGAVVSAALPLLSVVLSYRTSAVISSFLFATAPFITLLSGLLAWRKGNSSARYLTIAWSIFLISVSLMSLRTLGLIPGSLPLELAMQLGSALDALLLSLALADRINRFRKERIKHQMRALKAAHDKEQFIQAQNRLLEERVIGRTEEISAQNEELQVQREVIEELNKQLLVQNEDLEEEVMRRTWALDQSNRQLVSQNRRLEQFASITSHNLRGPIANILGLGSIIERDNLSELNQQCLDHLQKATYNLDMVIRDLNEILGYTNKLQQEKQPVVLDEVLQQVVEEQSAMIAEEGAQIIGNFEEVGSVEAVFSYVKSVFFHLVTNAIKFRSPTVPVVVRLTSRRVEGNVVVAISDNGLGMDTEAYKEKIFTLYQRFHTHREGRGLGLYLVKTQMEALDGHVEVESKVGKGTTFRLYFASAYSAHAVSYSESSSGVR